MPVYARIVNDEVVNRAVFDGEPPKDWPNREQWRLADITMQIGAKRDVGRFVMPAKPVDPEREAESLEARDRALLMEALLDDFAVRKVHDMTLASDAKAAAARRAAKVTSRGVASTGPPKSTF